MIHDVNHFDRIEGVTVTGATEKDVLRDPSSGTRYIAKQGRRNPELEVATEYAIYLIGRTLGVTVARAQVGTYRGTLRFMSEIFLESEGSLQLVHGVELFSELVDEASLKPVLGNQALEQEMFSVQSVKAAFGAHYTHQGFDVEEQLFGGFVAMLTHDALIGVTDRHHENWGLLIDRDPDGPRPQIAPLFDSARGLFCDIDDDSLRQRFQGPEGSHRLDRYVRRASPLVGFSGLKPTDGKFIKHHELLAAVYWAYPKERAKITGILGAYRWLDVRAVLINQMEGMMSRNRINLILVCLRRRIKAIWRAIDAGPPKADII